MGTCWNCGKEVILRDEETRCDNCKEIVRYWCHECKHPFDVEDKHHKQIKLCHWCWSFLCPNCGTCGPQCEKYNHVKKIKKISPTTSDEQATDIVAYFEEIKSGKIKKICKFGVAITYAKDRIKNILAKMENFKVKDNMDLKAFKDRLECIENAEKYQFFTIKQTKEPGSYGQEWRDIFNLCVCLGLLKWERRDIIDKETKKKIGEYDSWTKNIDIGEKGKPCKYLNAKEIIVKYCPRCKKTYSHSTISCSCHQFKKGKDKDTFPLLKEKLSNIPTCSALDKFKRRNKNGCDTGDMGSCEEGTGREKQSELADSEYE